MGGEGLKVNMIYCYDTEAGVPTLCVNTGRLKNQVNDLYQRSASFFLTRSFTGANLYLTLFWILFGIMISLLARDIYDAILKMCLHPTKMTEKNIIYNV